MSSYLQLPLGSRFTTTLRSFVRDEGLPFSEVLAEETIQSAAEAQGMNFASDDDCVYNPAMTLWAFLTQAMSSGGCCVAAVSRIIALRIALGLTPCSANTGAYCKARAKLSECFLRFLTYVVGETVE